MKQKLATLLIALAVLAPPGASLAQDTRIPDLKGQWVGTSDTVMFGVTQHHNNPHQGPRLSTMQFTISIEGQDGRRFWGNVTSSPTAKEPLVGVISYDGKTITAQDSDGLTQGILIDRDTMELIYSHATSSSMVAATLHMKRQK